MVIVFTLQNCGDRQPWDHLYCLSSSSSPSIRTWDQHNGETLAHQSPHHKVKQINRVRGYQNDQFDGRLNSFEPPEDGRMSRNHNSKFTKASHMGHPHLSLLLQLQTRHFKLAGKDFEISEYHQDMWNRYLML